MSWGRSETRILVRACRRVRGFTLLEVMVALSILAIALVAISGITANAYQSSDYARGITVATLLARSKMIDIELELEKDGFPSQDKEMDGDFSDEGHPEVRWQASVREVEIELDRMLSEMLGSDPEASAEDMSDKVIEMLSGGVGKDAIKDLGDSKSEPSELQRMMGGGMLENLLKQAGETLSKSIREIALVIAWGPENEEETLRFVQYVTTDGRLKLAPLQQVKQSAESVTPGGRGRNSVIPQVLPSGALNPAITGGGR